MLRTRADVGKAKLLEGTANRHLIEIDIEAFLDDAYAISQIEYCRNFIFRRNFPIHKLFERSCERQ